MRCAISFASRSDLQRSATCRAVICGARVQRCFPELRFGRLVLAFCFIVSPRYSSYLRFYMLWSRPALLLVRLMVPVVPTTPVQGSTSCERSAHGDLPAAEIVRSIRSGA